MFGSADYAADLGTAPGDDLFNYPRARLVIASAAAGISPPIDGPTMALYESEILRSESLVARSMGMGGKLCIHPQQVAIVNDVFRPSVVEQEWAQDILDADVRHGGGAFVLNGEMVDAPVLARARSILGR
jgi:citrate lyase subunit beta/citryl-CoA lyase